MKFKIELEFDINDIAVQAGLKPPCEMDLIVFTRLFNKGKDALASDLLGVLIEDGQLDDLMEDAGFMPKQDESIVNDPDEDDLDSGSSDSYDDSYEDEDDYQDEEPDYDDEEK